MFKGLSNAINVVGNTVAIIMAIGAMFGALNTMYAAVAARGLEIATLRAIGFDSSAIMLRVMVEALLLSLLGGLIGAGLAWAFFNGHSVSTLGAGFAQVVFQLTVTRTLIFTGIVWACAIGLLGGFSPRACGACTRRRSAAHGLACRAQILADLFDFTVGCVPARAVTERVQIQRAVSLQRAQSLRTIQLDQGFGAADGTGHRHLDGPMNDFPTFHPATGCAAGGTSSCHPPRAQLQMKCLGALLLVSRTTPFFMSWRLRFYGD